jgi:hypothetical protein
MRVTRQATKRLRESQQQHPHNTLERLPRQLLENVYDRLHVHDRMRLNAALPRGMRVVRSTHTDSATDARLAACVLALRRCRRPLGKVLVEFLQRHRADPTVVALVAEHGLTSAELPAIIDPPFEVYASRIRQGTLPVSLAELEPFLPTHVHEVTELALVWGTPEQFDMLMASELFRPLLFNDRCVFKALCYRNDRLLKHLLSRHGPEVSAAVTYVTRGPGANLLVSPRTREVALDLLPLSEDDRGRIEGTVLHELNVEEYARIRGKRITV